MCIAHGKWCQGAEHPADDPGPSALWKPCDLGEGQNSDLLVRCPNYAEGPSKIVEKCTSCRLISLCDDNIYQKMLAKPRQAAFNNAMVKPLGLCPAVADVEFGSPEYFENWDAIATWEKRCYKTQHYYRICRLREMRLAQAFIFATRTERDTR